MSAALYANWDIVNLLLRRGANAKLLNDVCFQSQKRTIYLFTKLTQQITE
jgi:hypothetical protein